MSVRLRVAYLITALVGLIAGVVGADAADPLARAANGCVVALVLLVYFWFFGIGAWRLAGWLAVRSRRRAESQPGPDTPALDRRSFLRLHWPARNK